MAQAVKDTVDRRTVCGRQCFRWWWVLGWVAVLHWGRVPLHAHRLDELLQSALVAIEPDAVRLELHLNPGVSMVEPWMAALDRNRDGAVSNEEAMAYARQLDADLSLRVDGRELLKEPVVGGFPAIEELRAGWGILHLEFRARLGGIGAGQHHLVVANRHWTNRSVYLVNALQPVSTRVHITGQDRDETQRHADIAFTLDSEERWTRGMFGWKGLLGWGGALLGFLVFHLIRRRMHLSVPDPKGFTQ